LKGVMQREYVLLFAPPSCADFFFRSGPKSKSSNKPSPTSKPLSKPQRTSRPPPKKNVRSWRKRFCR
jgi:hypothetical protein